MEFILLCVSGKNITIDEYAHDVALKLAQTRPIIKRAISKQLEIPFAYKHINGTYYVFANFLSLLRLPLRANDEFYILVCNEKPKRIREFASDYLLHLLNFCPSVASTHEFTMCCLQYDESNSLKKLQAKSLSQESLATLLNLSRQTIRTANKRTKE